MNSFQLLSAAQPLSLSFLIYKVMDIMLIFRAVSFTGVCGRWLLLGGSSIILCLSCLLVKRASLILIISLF